VTASDPARPAVQCARAPAQHGPRPAPATWALSRLVVRRWAATMGTTSGRLVGSIAVGLLLVALGARHFVEPWHPDRLAGSGSVGDAAAMLLAVTISLFFGAAAFGVFATRSRSLPHSLSVLRTLPVPARDVGRAGALPVAALGVGLAIALLPTVGVVTTRLTGRGAPHAVLLLGLVVAGGAASGRLMLGGAERALRWPGAASLRLTAAYLAWTVLLGISLVAPSTLTRWTDRPEVLLVLAPLGWPLCWWALVDPTAPGLAGAAAATTGVWWLARRVDPGPGTWANAGATRATPDVRPVRFAHPFPVVRFEARRLVRNPRTLEATVVSGFCALLVVVAVAWIRHRSRAAVGVEVVALLGAQVVAGFAVTGRGLSARRRPVEAFLGLSDRRHLVAVFLATLALAVITSAPGLLAAGLSLPAGVVSAWIGSLPLYVAVGLLVSVSLTPEPGNGASEAGAVMVYAAVSAAALTFLDRQDPGAAIAIGSLLMAALLAVAVAVEKRHRRPT